MTHDAKGALDGSQETRRLPMPKLVPCKCGHHGYDHKHEHPGVLSPAFACDACECDSYRPDFEAVK